MGNLKRNLFYAFGSQGIQLLRSTLVSLMIPKVMGIEDFGFWQLFIFYTQYGGFLHLGLIDGISLKEGGKEYSKLNFALLGYQLRVLFVWVCVTILPFCILGFYNPDKNRLMVILFSCFFVVVNILYTFFLYVMQAVNKIKEASIGKVIISVLFLISICILLLCQTTDYVPYISCYIVAHIIGLLFYAKKCPEIQRHVHSIERQSDYKNELWNNIKSGFVLLISNIMGMLIVGYGRFMIDNTWGIKTFAKVSFAFMFVNFFLMFINQGSQVLFPDLRRRNVDEIGSFYNKFRIKISLFFPFALLLYAPICGLIGLWLPAYKQSMEYLVFLMPLCIFDSKMNLLCNTLFKVFNKINLLIFCNGISLLISVILISISIYALDNVRLVTLSMLIAICIRSVLAEKMLSRVIVVNKNNVILISEIVVVVSFVCLNSILPLWGAWFGILVVSSFHTLLIRFINRKH